MFTNVNSYNFNPFSLLAIDEAKGNFSKEEVEETDLSTENELAIEPKASMGSFKPSSAAQEMARNLEKLKNGAKRGFSLRRLGQTSKKIKMVDTSSIAEDFRNTSYTRLQIAQRHMWKRLNFFLVMSRYIQEQAPFLTDVNFPRSEKRQFTVQAYVVPPSYTRRNIRYERAHISILNKIIVKQETHLYLMVGPLALSAKNVKTTVKKFFNLCDIVPCLINSIDWYAEYHLRSRTSKFLNSVKNGSQTFANATYHFACEYGKCLIGLLDRMSDKNSTPPISSSLNDQFRSETEGILANREIASQYINGMLEAIIDFRTRFPSLKHLQNESNLSEYSLYEKI